MKTYFLSAILCFSFLSGFAIGVPKACTDCKYGFSQQGTRFLVGATRAYYGSEKRATKAEFSATPTSTDRKLLLQDVYPGMNGMALFWNYDVTGTAHLTELSGSTEVFKRNGSTYAWACENLLEICAYAKEEPIPPPAAPSPKLDGPKVDLSFPGFPQEEYREVRVPEQMVVFHEMFAVYDSGGGFVRNDYAKDRYGQWITIEVPASQVPWIIRKYPQWAPCGCATEITYYQRG
jgi:hypothetical protein